MKKSALLCALLVLAASCDKKPAAAIETQAAANPAGAEPTSAAEDQTAPPKPAVKPVPAVLPDVLARVNGTDVRKDEFEDAVRNVEAQNGPVPPDRRDEFYRLLLDDLIGYHLLQQESAARKLTVSAGDVESRISQIREQVGGDAQFQKLLAERQTSVDALRENLRNQMMVDKLIETEVTGISVPASAVAAFYDENPDQFVQPETVRASHILIRIPEQADDASKAKARARAEQLLASAKGGADFAKLATENSEDPGSAANGGQLPPFARGQMIPEFEMAAFQLQPGQLSGVVETAFGFHVIKVHERSAATMVPLDKVKDQIQAFLESQQRQEKVSNLIADLRAKGKIEILI